MDIRPHNPMMQLENLSKDRARCQVQVDPKSLFWFLYNLMVDYHGQFGGKAPDLPEFLRDSFGEPIMDLCVQTLKVMLTSPHFREYTSQYLKVSCDKPLGDEAMRQLKARDGVDLAQILGQSDLPF